MTMPSVGSNCSVFGVWMNSGGGCKVRRVLASQQGEDSWSWTKDSDGE